MFIWVNCSKSLQNFFKGVLKLLPCVLKVELMSRYTSNFTGTTSHMKFCWEYLSNSRSLGLVVRYNSNLLGMTYLHLLSVKKHNQKPTQSKPKTYGLAIKQNCLATLGIWDKDLVFHMENVHNRLLMLISIACVWNVWIRKPHKFPLYSWRKKIS